MTQGTANGTPGTQTFTIKPSRITTDEIDAAPDPPFLEKLTQVNFFIYTGFGGFKSESIVLRQINYALLTKDLEDSYLPDDPYEEGDEIHWFTVKSNTRWKIINITGAERLRDDGDSKNVKIGKSGGQDNQITETELRFVTKSAAEGGKGIVTISFGCADRTPPLKFTDVEVHIRIDQPPTVTVPEEIFLTESKPLMPDGITIASCVVGRAEVATVTKNKDGVWSITGQKAGSSPDGDTTQIIVTGKSSNGVEYHLEALVRVKLPTEWHVAPAPKGHKANSGFHENAPLVTMDSVLASIKRVYELHTITNGDIWTVTPTPIIVSGVLTHATSNRNMVNISASNLNALGDKEPAYPPLLIKGSTSTTGRLEMASTASYASLIYIANGNSVTLGSNLTLTGGKGQSNSKGGAVYADSAEVYLDGATITGGTTGNSSGVYLTNNSLLELLGGTVKNNMGTAGGYGVYADSSRIVMRNTAEVSNNGSHGIYLARRSLFEMDGGVIGGDEISGNGGSGVFADSSTVILSGSALITGNAANGVQANSIFEMKSGVIAGNGQNGVYYMGNTVDTIPTTPNQFVMYNGEISANKKSGVRVEKRRFVLQGGTIKGNLGGEPKPGRSGNVGGGVYVGKEGVFEMRDGKITEHLSLAFGGGVSVEGPDARASLFGGGITGNSATNGGGVYVEAAEGNHFLKDGTSHIYDNLAAHGNNVRAGNTDVGSRNVESPSGEKLEAWFAGGLWAYDTTENFPWNNPHP
ncbi:hypothetical protein AGMMS49965_24510 [Bacteroidia bacterium]|nr:hypothetical protein AGMMS49965_24510 [Bacteroidia bacterium]